ncbi:MAG: response regulator [Rhodospirillales bacterium]|nr:response regulator [Rhodospirillales bacterium]
MSAASPPPARGFALDFVRNDAWDLPSAGRAATFARAPAGLAVLDLAGRIVDINAAFLEILGADSDAAIATAFVDHVAADCGGEVNRRLAKLVLGGGRRARLERVALARDGKGGRAVLLDAAVFDRDGEPCGFILSAAEMPRLRPATDAALVQAQKMQAIGQLAGGIAHDFNNLLTVIIGFSDLLLARHPAGERSHDDLMEIRGNAARAASLVRQLLAFSRQQALAPVILDPAAAIRELSHMLARLLGPSITLRIEADGTPVRIRADAVQLDQVIVNLAVNARDAMVDGGVLTIRTGVERIAAAREVGADVMPAGDYACIRVSDTGVGISSQIIARIFEPFFTTKAAGEGTGLGLATVYGIVRQSEGYIVVDSAAGQGTTFSIYLPPVAAEAAVGDEAGAVTQWLDPAPSPARQPEPQALPANAATVLLVDDEPGVRAFAARALRRTGYRVLEAGDGEAALALLQSEPGPVDLLVTDVVMPGMDGHTLMRLLGESMSDLAVVFMSGYAEGVLGGGDGAIVRRFLMKPFTLSELIARVGETLAERRQRQAGQARAALAEGNASAEPG